jgi:hypothetical protein
MARDERFTFLIDRDERQMITALAQRLRRTESDTVRFVVLEAARALECAELLPCNATPAPSDMPRKQAVTQ